MNEYIAEQRGFNKGLEMAARLLEDSVRKGLVGGIAGSSTAAGVRALKRLFHIEKYVSHTSDPDQRDEAVAYCNYSEECSGSGRHGLLPSAAMVPKEELCQKCLDQYDRGIY